MACILGLGGSNHDFAACIMKDGQITAAIEDERLTRTKYGFGRWSSLKGASRQACLRATGIHDPDIVVAHDLLLPASYRPYRDRVRIIGHHLGHAASAFLLSPFEKAAILVVDNNGGYADGGVETISYGIGSGSDIDIFKQVVATEWGDYPVWKAEKPAPAYIVADPDDSLGHFYKLGSQVLGFRYGDTAFTEDGKTMGLAAWGQPELVPLLEKYFDFDGEGGITIRLRDGSLVGQLVDFLSKAVTDYERFERRASIASSFQEMLERCLLYCADYLWEKTRLSALCIAGGVALNCVANGKLLTKTKFDKVFVPPAPGDAGLALGCSAFGAYKIAGIPRETDGSGRIENSYLGIEYSDADIRDTLARPGICWEKRVDIIKVCAELLQSGCIVGWFEGKSEFGPRALGHRSILADPSRSSMKHILNSRVKHREFFRPFAPSILAEQQQDYFAADHPSRFMEFALPVRPEKRGALKSAEQIDGTARLHTVTTQGSGRFYELIREFYRLMGVPAVLNTSFNLQGMPIVESPSDALDCFCASDIDWLVLEDYLVWRSP